MPDWVTFEMKGLDAIQRKLEQLPEKVARKGLKKALQRGGAIIASAFAAFAPRLSGFLAEHFNIKIKFHRGDLAASAYVGPDGKMDYPEKDGTYRTKTSKTGRIKKVGRVAVAAVARFLELGTSKMPAKPFMTPAWESHKEIARDAIIDDLRATIEETAGE